MSAPGTYRPARICPWCGHSTTRVAGTCAGCLGVELNLRRPVTDDCALPPGRWVLNRRGVQEFVADPNASVARAQCGTDAGYYRHRRALGEQPCNACKSAHRIAERVRQERREASLA